MNKARAFFFVCGGVFLLVLTYHLGARSAGAAGPARQVAGFAVTQHQGDPEDREVYVLTREGDVYFATFKTLHLPQASSRVGNVWTGGEPIK